jgi:molybdopterin-guanine dinucleotide biosynthesis protein A
MCACDVPLVDGAVLGILVDELDGHDAVIPVVSGRDQPTVSCYAPEAARVARELAASGARSLREWIARLDVRRLTAADWPGASFDETFTDVDTPEDLVRVTALVRDRR